MFSVVGIHTVGFVWSKFVQRYDFFFVYARFFLINVYIFFECDFEGFVVVVCEGYLYFEGKVIVCL